MFSIFNAVRNVSFDFFFVFSHGNCLRRVAPIKMKTKPKKVFNLCSKCRSSAAQKLVFFSMKNNAGNATYTKHQKQFWFFPFHNSLACQSNDYCVNTAANAPKIWIRKFRPSVFPSIIYLNEIGARDFSTNRITRARNSRSGSSSGWAE